MVPSNMSKSSSRSWGSSWTSGKERLPDFGATKLGDEGLSLAEAWTVESMEEAELGYLRCPRVEKVGVTGEGASEAEEFWLQ